jgi:hypothetical protein
MASNSFRRSVKAEDDSGENLTDVHPADWTSRMFSYLNLREQKTTLRADADHWSFTHWTDARRWDGYSYSPALQFDAEITPGS